MLTSLQKGLAMAMGDCSGRDKPDSVLICLVYLLTPHLSHLMAPFKRSGSTPGCPSNLIENHWYKLRSTITCLLMLVELNLFPNNCTWVLLKQDNFCILLVDKAQSVTFILSHSVTHSGLFINSEYSLGPALVLCKTDVHCFRCKSKIMHTGLCACGRREEQTANEFLTGIFHF